MIFLRHPTTDAGADLCYGQKDVGLGPGAEAEMAAALAAVAPIRAIHASDLSRCRALAERFARRDGVAPVYDERLREYHFGAWEGRRWDDIPLAESELWTADLWASAPPGGETFAALHARVTGALAEIPAGALVVAHAGVIRAARMILTGASFETVFAEKVPYCVPLSFGAGGA